LKPELLIDKLYRQTFRKPPLRNESLRNSLIKCQRFVLDDTMASFLVDLHHEFFLSAPHSMKRLYRRMDEVRHFSRLPYANTWVEYSHYAVMKRSLEIRDRSGHIIPDELNIPEEELKLSEHERVGWLMLQHSKIDTAFTCSKFENRKDRDDVVYYAPPCDFVWVTDNQPSPWRLTPLEKEVRVGAVTLHYASELATATPGYIHDNVGFRCVHAVHEATMQKAMHQAMGTHNWFWVFLSTLNKIPLTGFASIKPSHGFVGGGSYRKYLNYHMITLHIPDTMRRKVARAIVMEVIRRRAHMVRGHWRDDWMLPKGNKTLWIEEHQRGDASLGWVNHDYTVKHDKP
jgi:hypothetical protein